MENIIQTLSKSELPTLLQEIPDPPKQLFIRGKFPETGGLNQTDAPKFLCVVGSRKNSRYGKDVCETLVSGLAGYNIIIVSGLALGIDAIAHEAALAAKLTTIAVPGSGLNWDVLYPVANRKLAKRILAAGGTLVSECENDFKARPESFPERNRIMAGMSHAVLVIEAEIRSGTLITSRLATEYNRDVLTVPGSIFSSKTEGPHMLIRLGATPVRNSEDILVALGLVDPEAEAKKKTGKRSGRASGSGSGSKREYKNCSENEKKILSILEVPMNRHDLIKESGMDTSTAIITLSLLELKGLVNENMGEIRLK